MRDETRPLMSRGAKLSVAATVAALIALLALAPLASAASDPVASGKTTITLDNGLYKKLKKSHVKVTAVKPATVKGKKITLPIKAEGSTMDPTTGAGKLNHKGGFKLKAGKRKVVVKNLVLDTTKKSLSGKVGKKNLKIAVVAGASIVRDGFGLDVVAKKLKLTKKAAKQLNKALDENVFKANRSLGSARASEQPETVTIKGGSATLTTSLETVKKLKEDNVDIEVIAPTNVASLVPPAFSFPVSGGSIAPDAGRGVVQTNGGLKLVQDWTKFGLEKHTIMTLNAIWVDLGTHVATVEVTVESTLSSEANLGVLGRSSIADVSMTGATVKSNSTSLTVTVENASATLQAVTAETLNSLFAKGWEAVVKTPAKTFAAGDPLGTFTFTAQTQ